MFLDWVDMGDVYVAGLPAAPGYQSVYPNEVRVASRPNDDDVWLFEMLIGVGDKQVPLYNYDFGIPYGGSADEMMDAVENLDPQDIADVLGDFGFAPEEDTTAGRHASRRKADLGALDWVESAPDRFGSVTYTADIPGTLYQVDVKEGFPDDWGFMIRKKDGRFMIVDESAFGIHMASTAEEMMNEVEHLSVVDISRVCDEHRYN